MAEIRNLIEIKKKGPLGLKDWNFSESSKIKFVDCGIVEVFVLCTNFTSLSNSYTI